MPGRGEGFQGLFSVTLLCEFIKSFQGALGPPNPHSNIAHACARRLDYKSRSNSERTRIQTYGALLYHDVTSDRKNDVKMRFLFLNIGLDGGVVSCRGRCDG